MGRVERPAWVTPAHLRYMYSEMSPRVAVYSYARIKSDADSFVCVPACEKAGDAPAESCHPPASATTERVRKFRLDPCSSSPMAAFTLLNHRPREQVLAQCGAVDLFLRGGNDQRSDAVPNHIDKRAEGAQEAIDA
jgi:hypothetical protein